MTTNDISIDDLIAPWGLERREGATDAEVERSFVLFMTVVG